jgi:ribosomal protein S21
MLRRAVFAVARAARGAGGGINSGSSVNAATAAAAPAAWPMPAAAPATLPSPSSLLLAQPQQRTMSAVVDVHRNNVEQAFSRLRRQLAEAGLPEDLARRRCFTPTSDLRHARRKQTFNRRMGGLIRQRLGWVMRRRKVKV